MLTGLLTYFRLVHLVIAHPFEFMRRIEAEKLKSYQNGYEQGLREAENRLLTQTQAENAEILAQFSLLTWEELEAELG